MALFRPARQFHRVTDIEPQLLLDMGIRGLVLDADNTLATHHAQTPLEGVPEWLDALRRAGIRLRMVSNARESRCRPFAHTLGLAYTSLGPKPLPFGFWRAARAMGLKRREIAAVGDQLFTDMLGAHLAGVTPLLVEPIEPEKTWSFKLRRRLEKPLLSRYREIGS